MTIDSTDEAWKRRIAELKAMGIEFAPENTSPKKFENTELTFWGGHGYLLKREEKYWLMYGGSGHGGPDIVHEITETEYYGGRDGSVDILYLMQKYPEKNSDSHRSAEIMKRWREKGISDI